MTKREILNYFITNDRTQDNFWPFRSTLNKKDRSVVEKNKVYFHDKLEEHYLNAKEMERKRKDKEFIKVKAKELGISQKQFALVQIKASEIISKFLSGYVMGSFYSISVPKSAEQSVRIVERDNRKEYKSSFRWRASHGYHHIQIPLQDLIDGEIIGGVLTVVEKGEEKKKIKKCYWYEQHGEYAKWGVEKVEGYLTGNYHAHTIEGAVEWRKRRSEMLLNRRRENIAMNDRINMAQGKFVGYDHLFSKFGICGPGSDSFIREHDLDPEMGYSVGYLYSLAQNTWAEDYVRRML